MSGPQRTRHLIISRKWLSDCVLYHHYSYWLWTGLKQVLKKISEAQLNTPITIDWAEIKGEIKYVPIGYILNQEVLTNQEKHNTKIYLNNEQRFTWEWGDSTGVMLTVRHIRSKILARVTTDDILQMAKEVGWQKFSVYYNSDGDDRSYQEIDNPSQFQPVETGRVQIYESRY